MADDCGRSGATSLVIGGCEEAREFGPHTEYVEKVSAYPKPFGPTHFSTLGQVEIASAPRENTGEPFLSISNLLPNRIGDRRVERLSTTTDCVHIGELDVDELLCVTHRQSLETHRVDELEDCSVSTDAERQRQHRHRREAGVLQQHPHTKS